MASKATAIVLTVANLAYEDNVASIDAFEKIVREAQENEDEFSSGCIEKRFDFDGEFRTIVDECVSQGWLEVENGEYSMTGKGTEVYNSEYVGLVDFDERKTLKKVKRLYNQ